MSECLTKTCLTCGKTFIGRGVKYCTKSCWISQRNRLYQSRIMSRKWQDESFSTKVLPKIVNAVIERNKTEAMRTLVSNRMKHTMKNVEMLRNEYGEFTGERRYCYERLDIGSGNRPTGDVNVDLFPDSGHHRDIVAPIYSKGSNFVRADSLHLPFRDKVFDLAYSHHCIEHVDNPYLFIEEAQRVSKKILIEAPVGKTMDWLWFRVHGHRWGIYPWWYRKQLPNANIRIHYFMKPVYWKERPLPIKYPYWEIQCEYVKPFLEDLTEKVSIVIPCYNEEKYIANTIRALLNQDYKNIEIIVVENGSTDRTLKEIMSVKDDLNRITVCITKHVPAYSTRQINIGNGHRFGIGMSHGEYVIVYMAHAIAQPNFVSTLLREIKSHPDAIAVGAPDEFVVNSSLLLKMFFTIWQKFRFPRREGYVHNIHMSIWRKKDVISWPQYDDIEMNLLTSHEKKWLTKYTKVYNINKYNTLKNFFIKMIVYGNGRAMLSKQYDKRNMAIYALFSIPLMIAGYGIGFALGVLNFDVGEKFGW